MAAGDVERVDGVAAGVEGFEDMANAQRNADAGAPVEAAERIEVAVERQAGNDAQRDGVAERRAVAVEIGQDMQALGQVPAFARRAIARCVRRWRGAVRAWARRRRRASG